MQHISILCAIPQEVSPFKQQIRIDAESRAGAIKCWEGRYQGKKITLVQSGVGKVHAAAASQFVITQYAPDAIFSCGTAGSLDNRCQIGDIVIGKSTAQHDYGFVLPEVFIHFGIHWQQATGKRKFRKEFPADPSLLATAESIEKTWEKTRVFYGSILTGDQVIFSSEKRQSLATQFSAMAVDMESAAIAQVCETNTIPFLSVRGISDHADETISIDMSKIDPNEFSTYPSASFGQKLSLLTKALRYFSHHPSALKFSLQTQHNMKIAAKNSANFALSLLQTL